MSNGQLSTQQIEEALQTAQAGGVTRTKRVRKTEEEKAAIAAQKAEEKAQKKATREAAKALKASSKPEKKAHMTKVEKAGAKLPTLTERGAELLEETFDSMDASAISSFVQHALYRLRIRSTEASAATKLEVDQLVRITSGNSSHVGQLAKVIKVQRIRCYVTPVGTSKKVYLFNTDVIPAEDAASLEGSSNVQQLRSVG